MFYIFAVITVEFEEDVYSIVEDEGSIAPRLELEKPLNYCISIRAKLLNMTENATGELFFKLGMHQLHTTGV